jgi:GxxExxY protein
MVHHKITEKIIGCAYRAYNKMGFGFLESVYGKCLLLELQKAGLNAESQKYITVYYDSEIVGEFISQAKDMSSYGSVNVTMKYSTGKSLFCCRSSQREASKF